MVRLFDVELRRVASRRLVKAFLILAVAGIGIAATIVFVQAETLGPEQRAGAQAQAEENRAAELAACANGEFGIPQSEIPPGTTLQQFCDQMVLPPAEKYIEDPTFRYEQTRDAVIGTNILIILLLGLIGASMIGAEWHAGTITTLLTWEPRRIRVIVAKALAVALFAFLASVLLQAFLAAALLPTALVKGSTEGVDAAWWRDMVGVVLRGGLLAAMATVIGLAIASIARNTAFAIGVAFAWMAVLEPIIHGLRPQWEPWLFATNAARFMAGPIEDIALPNRPTAVAGLVIASYGAIFLGAAVAAFRVRDVT